MNARHWFRALWGTLLPLTGCTVEWHEGSSTSLMLGKVEVDATTEAELPLAAGAALRAHDLTGEIAIRVEPGTPRYRARWRAYGDDTAEAQQALAAAKIEVDSTGAGVELRTIVPTRRDGMGVRVDLELVVPADLALDLETTTGDIAASGPFTSALLATGYGDVRVSEVAGSVQARSSSGDVELSDVGGAVEATTSYGDVTLRACRGARIVGKSSSGDVVASDGGTGEWDLDSKYGDVKLAGGSGTLAIETSSGRIDVTRFTGSARARNGYGAIDLAGCFSSIDAASSSGDVSLRLEGIDGALREIALESKYGDVELVACLPLAGELAARTSYGEVECELPLAVVRRDEEGKRLDGRLGDGSSGAVERESSAAGGGARIRLTTASGNVRLQKGGR